MQNAPRLTPPRVPPASAPGMIKPKYACELEEGLVKAPGDSARSGGKAELGYWKEQSEIVNTQLMD